MLTRILIPVFLVLAAVSAVFYLSARPAGQATILPALSETTTPRPSVSLVEPVAHFVQRASKKPFGIYITPDTSPIQGDYHTGYHTGVDSEFTDTNQDVPVFAIADGTIVVRNWVKGYGGVIVIRHIINGVPLYALYGHLDQASFLPAEKTQVTAGEQIAILGDDHSQETDGVRKHLHFSISMTDRLDLRGYVQTERELTHWLNPLNFPFASAQ